MLTFCAGILAGFIHVVSGPDHLAAIAPLSLRVRSRAWLPGLRWGAGHAAGVGVIAVLSLLLRDAFPLEHISAGGDRLVGVLLLGIGFWALRRGLRLHSHEHEHDGEKHVHLHAHPGQPAAAGHQEHERHGHTHAAFGIGTLHGIAGSSHFLAILPALALPTTALACVYLTAYGVGTVAAMMTFSTATNALALKWSGVARVYRLLTCASGVVAMVVGVLWVTGFSF